MTVTKTADSDAERGPAVAPAPLQQLILDTFAGTVESAAFPCLGAKAVLHRDTMRSDVFERLGTESAARGIVDGLRAATEELDGSRLRSYVAFFTEPRATDELTFEHLLWRQLQMVHDLDGASSWDPTVSDDPDSAHFAFSVEGRAYFVVGLHPGSTRWARRFAWPALVFNPHAQFEQLRVDGTYDTMRARIRERDADLQGTVNPVMADHGQTGEARQYSGRPVGDDWRCPLDVHRP